MSVDCLAASLLPSLHLQRILATTCRPRRWRWWRRLRLGRVWRSCAHAWTASTASRPPAPSPAPGEQAQASSATSANGGMVAWWAVVQVALPVHTLPLRPYPSYPVLQQRHFRQLPGSCRARRQAGRGGTHPRPAGAEQRGAAQRGTGTERRIHPARGWRGPAARWRRCGVGAGSTCSWLGLGLGWAGLAGAMLPGA